jgi:Asp-tRNA(Asn)/Glu-tRNA(Gln) amidotransferase A subunit family amidase
VGNDSGGSLRVPAHFCGVATLKPTTGRVPNTGVLNHPGGLSDVRSQIGVLARTVRDVALACRRSTPSSARRIPDPPREAARRGRRCSATRCPSACVAGPAPW